MILACLKGTENFITNRYFDELNKASSCCFSYNFEMKKVPDLLKNPDDYSKLSSAELLAVIADFQQQLESREKVLQVKDDAIHQRDRYITLLEEQLRLKKAQQFAASSEKQAYQIHLFDEAELEEELEALREQLPDDADSPKPSKKKRRQRGFSDKLVRERIELSLSEDEKAGASKVFFTKVKEELQFIPAQLKVFEIWQEKAVFHEDGQEQIVAAKRPVHPLGKYKIPRQPPVNSKRQLSEHSVSQSTDQAQFAGQIENYGCAVFGMELKGA